MKAMSEEFEVITVGGGCCWCTEAVLLGSRQSLQEGDNMMSLRDVSIWERALTGAEITGMYTGIPVSGMTGYSTDCRAWWLMDDGTGAVQ